MGRPRPAKRFVCHESEAFVKVPSRIAVGNSKRPLLGSNADQSVSTSGKERTAETSALPARSNQSKGQEKVGPFVSHQARAGDAIRIEGYEARFPYNRPEVTLQRRLRLATVPCLVFAAIVDCAAIRVGHQMPEGGAVVRGDPAYRQAGRQRPDRANHRHLAPHRRRLASHAHHHRRQPPGPQRDLFEADLRRDCGGERSRLADERCQQHLITRVRKLQS